MLLPVFILSLLQSQPAPLLSPLLPVILADTGVDTQHFFSLAVPGWAFFSCSFPHLLLLFNSSPLLLEIFLKTLFISTLCNLAIRLWCYSQTHTHTRALVVVLFSEEQCYCQTDVPMIVTIYVCNVGHFLCEKKSCAQNSTKFSCLCSTAYLVVHEH